MVKSSKVSAQLDISLPRGSASSARPDSRTASGLTSDRAGVSADTTFDNATHGRVSPKRMTLDCMHHAECFGNDVSYEKLCILSWSLAGIATDEIDLLFSQISDNYFWDFMLLQETFVQTDTVSLECKHSLFVSSERVVGQRCPAILVHHKWAGCVRVLAESARWIALQLSDEMILVSLHLPHAGRPFSEFTECLMGLSKFLKANTVRHCCLGMDANVQVGGIVDHLHVGDSVFGRPQGRKNAERALLFLEFLSSHNLYLANTFGDVLVEHRATRYSWEGFGTSQIDYLAISCDISCLGVNVDRVLDFRTDHKLVWGCFAKHIRQAICSRRPSVRNWKPAPSWFSVRDSLPWQWESWDLTLSVWHRTALEHKLQTPRLKDPVLQVLLHEHASASQTRKRELNRHIWRRRRWTKRQRDKAALVSAAEHGKFPNSAPKNLVISWAKLCGNKEPSSVIHDFYHDIYCLNDDLMSSEARAKYERIEVWKALRIDLIPFRCTLKHMLAAIAKLKGGKGSPDGCTAEMYKALPQEAILQLCNFFTYLFISLVFPKCWTVVGASLIPKVVGASSLSKFRAIACLPVARKLCGYLWMQMLPPLRVLFFINVVLFLVRTQPTACMLSNVQQS